MKLEKRFRRQLRELEAIRINLTDGQRREVNAARRHLKIHNWWHYAKIVDDIHTKVFADRCPARDRAEELKRTESKHVCK